MRQRDEDPGRLQGAAALGVSRASRRRRRRPKIDFPKIDKDLVKTNFFEYLDFALQFAPPAPDEKDIRAKLAQIGVGPGKTFDFKDLSLEHKAGDRARHEGRRQEDRRSTSPTRAKDVNGWKIGSFFGDRAFFNGDWLLRAAGAKAGIYGNDAAEATYPLTRVDGDGQPLDGSKHNYTLTFADGAAIRRSTPSGR